MLIRFQLGACPAARRDLREPYSLHQTLMRIFGKQTPFRIDADSRSVSMRSAHIGDISTLPAEYLCEISAQREPSIVRAAYGFRLRAQPTRKKKREGRRSGVVNIAGDADRFEWLTRQGALHGFEIVREFCCIEDVRWVQSKSGVPEQQVVDFVGTLRVTDTASFNAALRSGIGRGKYLGCGLLIMEESYMEHCMRKWQSGTPGSAVATEAGCLCPVMDNCRGRGAWGTEHSSDEDKVFFISANCPLHGDGRGEEKP